jgi:hypothetical protein
MKPHLRYASYVVRHKYFVFRAGLKTGAPIWRLIIHDWSKLTPAEWGPYVRQFYDKENKIPGQFEKAWLHHIHKNPHHWNHWVLPGDSTHMDREHDRVLRMPDKLVREMVADWMGAGRAITGQWDIVEWYRANSEKIQLHPGVRVQVANLIYPMLVLSTEEEET